MDTRSNAATLPIQGQEPKELYLYVTVDLEGNFELDRRWYEPNQFFDSILVVDYKYTPWTRCGGNLL